MNLFCYDDYDLALFCRHCKNKSEAKKEILNNGRLALVNYVVFKHKRFSIKQVYQWK